MKRKIIFLVVLLLTILAVAFVLFILGVFKSQKSLLRVESDPSAIVYVNGEELGATPVEKDLPTGEITVKLIPISSEALAPYETKLSLTKGVKTIIKRKIGPDDTKSSGVVVSFEKEFGQGAPIAIVTTPDGASVKIDNIARGVAPIKLNDLSAGTHEIVVSAMGYGEERVSVQTHNGYKLTAIVTLARDGSPVTPQLATPSPTPASGEKMVEILETSVGYLRVRSESSVASEELARVEPGDKFKFVEEDGEWVKIEYEEGKVGWVSKEFTKITP